MGQVTASSLMLLPITLLVDRPWELEIPSGAAIGALVGTAALSTAAGYILYFRILSTAGATNLLLVTLSYSNQRPPSRCFRFGGGLSPEARPRYGINRSWTGCH